ncbi:hypothetical protein [Poriferisphaera sp. WC338]|uniref:hypothetical protein n=1 Tax=Poriferisphaera sp. WC338 TaxID=3425129 RepID=UPI003D8136A5
MLKKIISLSSLLLLLFVSTGCPAQQKLPTPDSLGLVDYPAKGWRIFSVPTEGDAPGSIFAIKDGAIQPVDDATAQVNATTSKIALPTAKSVRNYGARLNAFGTFITSGLPVEAGFEADGTRRVAIELTVEGAIKEQVTRTQLNAAIQEYVNTFGDSLLNRDGETFYVIQSAISATQITFKFSDVDVTRFNLESRLAALANADTNLTFQKNDGFELIRKFDKPMRMFYQPAIINLLPALSGNPKVTLNEVPAESLLNVQPSDGALH